MSLMDWSSPIDIGWLIGISLIDCDSLQDLNVKKIPELRMNQRGFMTLNHLTYIKNKLLG